MSHSLKQLATKIITKSFQAFLILTNMSQLKHVGEKKKSFIRDLYFSYPYGCILLYYLCIFYVFNENVWKYGNCLTSS